MPHAFSRTTRRAASALVMFSAFAAGASAQTVAINPATTYQTVRGFGGFSGAGWAAELTAAQVDAAFGTGTGQIGLSIMRLRIDPDPSKWSTQLASAQLAKAKGAILFGTPWTPPANMKTNNSLVQGSLLPSRYGDYTTHLLNFASTMQAGGAALYAISIQNEPDFAPDYESCLWNSQQFIDYLSSQGSRFGTYKVIAGESATFYKPLTDPILGSATAAPQFDIVAGHLYGVNPSDYSLARAKGKEVWMTEHFTDSTSSANDWSKAMPVALELHNSMVANYSAYVWWYIRRSYGLLTEDGNVSKRGYIMAQFAKYVRPGSVRVAATEKPYADVFVTAYKNTAGKLVVVAINSGTSQRQLQLQVGSAAPGFTKYRTTSTDNTGYAGQYAVTGGVATAWIDPGSVNTFVSQ
ncbi:glycoside hydrolase family 30 beta sandwich domain-containing protein [Massilia sp.]|uniref:glycoside hydrolase family 30 beta sandwich domain-containing protein n=1 Tax=Massilia sp. TaxID=1882437 RepID=UPI00352E2A80